MHKPEHNIGNYFKCIANFRGGNGIHTKLATYLKYKNIVLREITFYNKTLIDER